MCVICLLWNKDKITTKEAMRAAWELVTSTEVDQKHVQELYGKLEEQDREDRGVIE